MDISKLSKDHIMRRVGRMEQLASIRRYVIDDGKGRGEDASQDLAEDRRHQHAQ